MEQSGNLFSRTNKTTGQQSHECAHYHEMQIYCSTSIHQLTLEYGR